MARSVGLPALLCAAGAFVVLLIYRFTGREDDPNRGVAQIVRIQNRYIAPIWGIIVVVALVVAAGAVIADALT